MVYHLWRVFLLLIRLELFLFGLLVSEVLADLGSIVASYETAPCRDILNNIRNNLFPLSLLLDDSRWLLIRVRLLTWRVFEPSVPHFVNRVDLLLAEAHPLEQFCSFADSLH